MTVVGRITSIHRYPVKSMGGERLRTTPLSLQGIAGDRVYAFVQDSSRSTFPWLTGRQLPALLAHAAQVDATDPRVVHVTTPSGQVYRADGPELLAQIEGLTGQPIHRLANYRGSFDVAPVSLIADATVRAIAKASATAEDPLRYRMNFYVDTGDGAPFAENAWVGRTLRLGATARVAVTERDGRCVMITLDHPTSAGSPRILRAVAELNGAAAGVYGAVITPGEVKEGDTVSLE